MDESKASSDPELIGMGIASPSRETSPEADARVAWQEYVRRIASGDEAALGSLYDESGSVVYSLALRMLGNPAEAEEVTLDVYMQVWRSAASFDSRRGTVFTWLVLLARSRAIDRIRSGGTRRRSEEPIGDAAEFRDTAASPEHASWLGQRREKVQAAMRALPADQQQAIALAFFEGLSHAELAERLGQPLGTVKTRIRLGLIKLRQLLGSEAEL